MDCPTVKEAPAVAFLWRAHAQSGFQVGLGERKAITSWGFGRSRLTFVSTLESVPRFP
jgi:hypothetical protein